MRTLIVVIAAAALVLACGGAGSGGYGSPIKVSPAVTGAPNASPGSTYSPDYGY